MTAQEYIDQLIVLTEKYNNDNGVTITYVDLNPKYYENEESRHLLRYEIKIKIEKD